MYKKVITGLVCSLTAVLLVGCSCAGGDTVETYPRQTYQIESGIDLAEYASFVTEDEWVNETTGDYFIFNDDGSYEGEIDGTKYNGTFTLNLTDGEDEGVVIVNATPEGEDERRTYTIKFDSSVQMTLTTDEDVSAEFTSKWTLEDSE